MIGFVPFYRRRASALHAARAGVSTGFCAALALVAVLYDNPIVLGGALAVSSYRRWEANERALRLGEPLPEAPPRWLAIALAGLSVVVAILVVIDAT
jgi:uncharacterized membrane protein YidH (DUF202 family)